jgi:ABC-type transport system substrate-binding protein
MKRWMVVMLALSLTLGAAAQTIKSPRSYYPQRARVIRVAPVVRYPFYGGMGLGFGYGFNPYGFYSPMWNYPRVIETTPSALSLQLEDINNEYQYKIKSTRKDKTLAKQDRKQKLRELRHQREDAIIEAKKSFYKSSNDNS